MVICKLYLVFSECRSSELGELQIIKYVYELYSICSQMFNTIQTHIFLYNITRDFARYRYSLY